MIFALQTIICELSEMSVFALAAAAAVAVAAFLHRPLVKNPLRRLYCDIALPGYSRTVAGYAGRDHAVEHVHAAGVTIALKRLTRNSLALSASA